MMTSLIDNKIDEQITSRVSFFKLPLDSRDKIQLKMIDSDCNKILISNIQFPLN
jgi:hypothetical protein